MYIELELFFIISLSLVLLGVKPWADTVMTSNRDMIVCLQMILDPFFSDHMGQVMELGLSCYLVLLSIDSKAR